MVNSDKFLKTFARTLRSNMTESERKLWSRIRRKQIFGVQFYRQKPLGDYIVDFYSYQVKLVLEVDGSQHLEGEHVVRDRQRDGYLKNHGIRVLRFDSHQVMVETDVVVQEIARVVRENLYK